MIWLPPTKRLAFRRLREAKSEIRELGSEIHRLCRTPALPNHNSPPPLPPSRESISTPLDPSLTRPTASSTISIPTLAQNQTVTVPAHARVSPEETQQRLGFYLRSGTIQTLKPLRYERRVARNRAIAWSVISGLLLLLSVAFVINLLQH